MNQTSFAELKLAEPIVRALAANHYNHPTPIQAQAIPPLLEGGDLIGCAQTGTGKTAAFALPILQKLGGQRFRVPSRGTRVLVLTPTRELAAQVGASFERYGRHLRFKQALVYGGVSQNPQVRTLKSGVDIVVATPGRLLDLMNQGHLTLSHLDTFVLDEADRMLDMGFLPDIKKIIAKLPRKRQTLLFSATMAPEILKLAKGILQDPIKVEASIPASTPPRIDERVLFVDDGNKRSLLETILKTPEVERTLVFTRTKHGANRLATHLEKSAHSARAIHGNKSQQTTDRGVNGPFRNGQCRVLVATDVAARGIDVAGITHVINYDLPNEPASYVHRIGRTARSGAAGHAISFCGAGERLYLRDIERLLTRSVPVDENHPYHSASVAKVRQSRPPQARTRKPGKGRSRRRSRRRCA